MSDHVTQSEITRMRQLYIAIVQQALDDAIGPRLHSRRAREMEAARKWFIRGGSDFRLIVYLAGLDPEAVQQRVVTLIGNAGRNDLVSNESDRPQKIEYNGQKHTLSEWSEVTGIDVTFLQARLNSGWTVEKALTTAINEPFSGEEAAHAALCGR